jgi:hypothetical protein
MSLPLKFAAGFLANALTQTARLSANALICLITAFVSITLLLLASLQILGGGTKQGKETARQSWACAKNSFKSGSFALLQALGLATCASPLIRAAQACSEPISPSGVFVPRDGDRNILQRALGLNSWPAQEKKDSPEAKPRAEPLRIAQTPEPEAPKAEIATKKADSKRTPKPEIRKKQIDKRKCTKAWESLVERYLGAKSVAEMDAIRAKMALEHPVEYIRALNAARSLRSRRRAA